MRYRDTLLLIRSLNAKENIQIFSVRAKNIHTRCYVVEGYYHYYIIILLFEFARVLAY